ncbi:caspase family protein [Falsiroseomonas stagni]|uniref:Uncharacterized protein, contains caspase domain n=1 Tax=Falsiroseomonas stagni DSM 19981 TaxID=1123062 RepID=A0A1I3Z644_9PROT|nr:caspase family protein [Falsiroseomonas stagni]SFK39515.1 Uncharacterized protein, contains caspase domain [Falsiroseomonas stagni DSM 19981]
MRLLRAWLFGLLLAGIAIAAPAAMAQGQRVALVVGNANYTAASVARLANPLNDAADVAAALSRLGFGVTVLSDGRQDAMRRALRDFGRAAEEADQAIVFFAGHGIEMGGENWLLPVDVEMRAEGDVQHEAIRLRDVMETVARARSLGLVILDACRDDPFRNRMQRSAGVQRSVGRGLARVEPARSAVLVAYAAKEGSTAADGAGRNSPYTTALLRHLGNSALEVYDLFREVHEDVVEATRGQQQPAIYGQMGRQRVFLAGVAPGAARPPQPATLPAITTTPIPPTRPSTQFSDTALQLEQAQAALGRRHFAQAFAILSPIARSGDATALYLIGAMYRWGQGRPQDPPAAVEYLSAAADRGHADAMTTLASMYRTGVGVPRDIPRALHWYMNAARLDHINASYRLALIYHQGDGVARDPVQAMMWLLVAEGRSPEPARLQAQIDAQLTPDQRREAERRLRQWRAAVSR